MSLLDWDKISKKYVDYIISKNDETIVYSIFYGIYNQIELIEHEFIKTLNFNFLQYAEYRKIGHDINGWGTPLSDYVMDCELLMKPDKKKQVKRKGGPTRIKKIQELKNKK